LEPLEARDLPSFLPPTDFLAGNFTRNPAVADLNGDGNPDVAVALDQEGKVAVLFGNGHGQFRRPVKYVASGAPVTTKVGDFNNDGIPDILVGTYVAGGVASLYVFLGTGGGNFQAPIKTQVTFGFFLVAVADYNNDGKLDVAVAYDSLQILMGNGNGTFQDPVSYNAGQDLADIAAGDVNHDGFVDLALPDEKTNSLNIMLNRGDGTFKPPTSFATGDSPLSVALGDVNKDGNPDAVVGNGDVIGFSNSTFSVLLGNGDGTFQPKMDFVTGLAPSQIVLADFNRDRKLDVATLRYSPGTLSVMLGNGNGTFGTQTDYGIAGLSIAVADVNHDRFPDVVGGNAANVRLLLNDTMWTAPTFPPGPDRSAALPADAGRPVNPPAARVPGAVDSAAVAPGKATLASPPPHRVQAAPDAPEVLRVLQEPFA
jgi:hypothetical protein